MYTKRATLLPLASMLALGFAFGGGSASASLIDCDDPSLGADISDRVNPSQACQILEPLGGGVNDSVSGDPSDYTVNQEAFFGFDDWLFDGKALEIGETPPTLVDFDGDGLSGTWSLADPDFWIDNDDLMFVFKNGSGTNLVGYHMVSGSQNGDYATPLLDPPFDLSGNSEEHEISHISVYYREGDGLVPPEEIPAPGVLGLFGLGLVGLGWATLRRRTDR